MVLLSRYLLVPHDDSQLKRKRKEKKRKKDNSEKRTASNVGWCVDRSGEVDGTTPGKFILD